MEIFNVNSSVCSFTCLLHNAVSHVPLHQSSGCISSLAFLTFQKIKNMQNILDNIYDVYLTTIYLFVYIHTYIKLFLKISKVTKSWAWPRFMIPWLYPHLAAPSLPRRLLPVQPRLLFKSPRISKLKPAVVQI